jgi:hypothetical protein
VLARKPNQDALALAPDTHTEGTVTDAHAGILRFAPSIYQVAAIAVLAAIFVVALLPRVETDFWWHLKVGAYITAHHSVPSHDYLSYTFRGHPWTDHEWLAELLLFGLYNLAGLWGPIVLFAFIICAAFAFVYWNMADRGLNRVLALFVLSAAFTASRGSWGPRIQMVSMFFLAVYAFALYRFQLTRDRRLLFVFPALMLLWTNLHGGFVLGLVIMAITLMGEGLNYLTRHEGALSPADLRALALALGGTFAVTVVNPNGVRQLLYPLTFILPNAYTNQIQESASPNFHMLVMMVFEAMLLLLIASAFVARPRFNWTNLFLVLAFTHLALSQVRNVPLWVVVVTPLLAVYMQAMGPALQEQFPRFRYRRRPLRSRLVPVYNLVLLGLVAILYALEAHTYITPNALQKAQNDNFPTGAIVYMRSHSLPSHVFASYGWGGYLLWNLFPRYTDFMDSRADTLFNTRMLHAYLNAYSGTPGWDAVLKQYQVQDVLIERDAPLAQLLATKKTWRLVYHDSLSVLYTKRQSSA